jgi:hypothetical protein
VRLKSRMKRLCNGEKSKAMTRTHKIFTKS